MKNKMDIWFDALISRKEIRFLPNNFIKLGDDILPLEDFDFTSLKGKTTFLLKEKKSFETYFSIITYNMGFPFKAEWEILVNSKKNVNIDSSEFIVELQTPYIFRSLRKEPVIIQGSYEKMIEYILSQKKLSDIFDKKIHVI